MLRFSKNILKNSRQLIVPVDYADNTFQTLATQIEQVNLSAFETLG